MSTVSYPHIEIRDTGEARIEGAGFKVRMLVEEYLAGASAEDLQREHPHLSLSQIHSALAYYHDNKLQIDQEIAELTRFAEEFRAEQGESLLAKKLRELGRELP
jgi:uncharacterized protein (DUF433 family)